MKKIMIIAAAMLTSIIAEAATVTWNTDAFYIPADDSGTYSTATKAAKGSVLGYLWEVDAATYAIYAAALDTVYTEFQKEGYGALGTATKENIASGMSRNVSLAGTKDWGVGETAYAIVLYTYNDGTKDWYVANAAKYEDMGTADASVLSLNNYIGGSIAQVAQGDAITGWSSAAAVPEPTSGLLLLMGMAGLALRRRRA